MTSAATTSPFLRPAERISGRCDNVATTSQVDSGRLGRGAKSFRSFTQTLKDFGIKDCRNPACLAHKQRFVDVAPRCAWTEFRSWGLVVASCSMTCKGSSRLLNDVGTYLSVTLAGFPGVWESFQKGQIEAFDALQMTDWLLSGPHREDISKLLTDGAELNIRAIRNAIDEIPGLRVCPRRLWNMALACARGLADLPEIVRLLRANPQICHGKHVECTADLCHFDDVNSTTVQQFHADTCPGETICGNYYFDPASNSRPPSYPAEFFPTAWHVPLDAGLPTSDSPTPNYPKYMAVSHVWSDGTGVGQNPPGKVNACLVNFFNRFTTEDMGMWWDTISLPTGRDQRALALSVMHRNYEEAVFTLVHDRELAEMDWKDDGSPCLALALSTWFSRGWTALELQKSKRIKVLFRNPMTGGPILKDLKDDILAKHNAWSHMGHRAASNVIRKACREYGGLLSRVVDTLRSRYTSWARDRMIIGSLMMDIKDFKTTWSKSQMTKAVISSRGRLTPEALVHGQITMSTWGPWSWCPISFLDLKEVEVSNRLHLGDDGDMAGRWRCIPLSHAVVDYTVHSHISVKLRIELALRRKEKCLLLAPGRTRYHVQRSCVLALNLGVEEVQPQHEGTTSRLCQYVGTVVASYKGLGFMNTVCFGSSKERPDFDDAIANTKAKDHGGWTPLHVAAREGRVSEVMRLLAEQPDAVREEDDFGHTPAQIADNNVQELFRSDGLLRAGKQP